ncbi:MAG: hypothetical protein ACD_42C00315G0001 [uncultured bacterium]|nr:MAG: hypothetical protein ACD_42C00315G0001 [uncultured bacterium]OGT32618.1 MAG: hypothetical protein A3C44_04480 [Gammaproteobacteria bacterium RIFCSPHIGHO2_02_FULL_39_13]
MNYRHIYHAGNFADVIKHIVLITLLKSLQKKEVPFCLLDTHAGIGLYDLHSNESQKKQESQNGIGKLFFSRSEEIPEIIKNYLEIVKKYNADELLFYPGSPLIAENTLRENDQLILCELHPDDFQTLKTPFSKKNNIAIHHMDAYLAMKAFLPPKLKRGLVLIDPPFEKTDEFQKIIDGLKHTLKHWRSGIFMIWYPIKNTDHVKKFYDEIQNIAVSHLIIEFGLLDSVEPGKLSECGLLIINPPWKIADELKTVILPYLSDKLNAQYNLYR